MEGDGTTRREKTSPSKNKQGNRQQEETEISTEQQAEQGQHSCQKIVKILYTNARSLLSKVDALSVTSSDHEPDIIVITET